MEVPEIFDGPGRRKGRVMSVLAGIGKIAQVDHGHRQPAQLVRRRDLAQPPRSAGDPGRQIEDRIAGRCHQDEGLRKRRDPARLHDKDFRVDIGRDQRHAADLVQNGGVPGDRDLPRVSITSCDPMECATR